jgi:hypothetical protein
MKQFTQKYQVWIYTDNAYNFTEYDSLQEAILSSKSGEWYLTKSASIKVTDSEEPSEAKLIIPTQPYVTQRSDEFNPIGGTIPTTPTAEERSAEDLARRYAGGPIGKLSETGLS